MIADEVNTGLRVPFGLRIVPIKDTTLNSSVRCSATGIMHLAEPLSKLYPEFKAI